ncbi:MAG: helix-turn-helix transcriptional regulator [Candidatus Cyclobacteriaceae bacterium M2_1C_046]
MHKKPINRLKVVLVEKGHTNKWLSEKMGVHISTVSSWCTNVRQPKLEKLLDLAEILNVDIRELLWPTR